MKTYLNFEIDKVEVLDDNSSTFFGTKNDTHFATARIQAFASGNNLHDMHCSEEVLKKTADTIYFKPILYVFNEEGKDFNGHTMNPEDSRPAGFVVPDSAEFTRLGDGRLSLDVIAKIWKKYTPMAMSIFKDSMGKKSVSVEMLLTDYEQQADGIIEMTDFEYLGVCILGDTVQEASIGANIEILSFAEDVQDFSDALLIEFSSRYDELDFSIPRGVKNSAQKGLDLYNQYDKGVDAKSLSHGRYLIKNNMISPDKARSMHSIFGSNRFRNIEIDPPSSDYIIYMLNGGKNGQRWLNGLCNKMQELDDQSLSYFEKITFPYDNIKDVNPAIKGIDPPVALVQANEIASMASAMIHDGMDKSHAWTTAISNFEKEYRVEHDKWVKREKMNKQDKNLKKEVNQMTKHNEHPQEEEFEKEDLEKEDLEKEDLEKEDSDVEEEVEEKEDDSAKIEEEADNSDEGEEADHAEEDDEKEDKDDDSDEADKPSMTYSIDIEKMNTLLSGFDCFEKEIPCEIELSSIVESLINEKEIMSEEIKSLRQFQEEVQKHEFKSAVDSTLTEIAIRVEIPEGSLKKFKEDAKNFTIDDIDAWKNKCKAKALDFAALEKDDKDDGITRYGPPWSKAGQENDALNWGKI